MSFDDPFFTDPDYMKKQFAKSDRFLRGVLIAYVLGVILFVVLMTIVLGEISNSIQKQGGLGKSIGHFVNDIKSQIK